VAIVDDMPGVTRDRLYRDTVWQSIPMTLVDTGGLDLAEEEETLIGQVRTQASLAMYESDLILFVVDGRLGLTPEDEELAVFIRKTGKPVVVCANKIDNHVNNFNAVDFYSLAF